MGIPSYDERRKILSEAGFGALNEIPIEDHVKALAHGDCRTSSR